MLDEGLRCIEAIRDRYDGRKRSPFNEAECGHHYARAMASWAAILDLSGFHYSAVPKELQFAPRWRPDEFRWFWVVPSGWGMVEQSLADGEQLMRWEVLAGELNVQIMRYYVAVGATVRSMTVEHPGALPVATLAQQHRTAEIVLADALKIAPGQPLVVRLAIG